jgi:hypothetical protein
MGSRTDRGTAVIVCVLKTGGIYTPDHVRALRAQCGQWAALEPFTCLTDNQVPGVVCHRLTQGWPGWWSKLEIFRPGVFPLGTRILYLDLDTIVTGPLRGILDRPEPFLALEDFYRHPPTFARGLGSGVLQWTAGDPLVAHWYEEFTTDPEKYQRACGWGGDQRYLETCLTLGATWSAVTFWQDVCPGQIVSYKVHCHGGRVPPGARIVCFHGRPKPWEVPALTPVEIPCRL